MEQLLLFMTTQMEEHIATFHTRFTQLKTEHDIAIQKSQRISVNELASNQKSIKRLIRSHNEQMKQLNGDQLWYDGTTRRQIPFGALIIGMLSGDNNMIDPVVASSCIFMENKTPETQAKGIVDNVRVRFGTDNSLLVGNRY